ncbi:hypothetical protein [Bhargavaea cecembensis]|uniref:hypothetical protein n=1 Tax=Bhargavaea cecembensis TaxID=394098 RepID=UPI00058BECF4|nr:hypothetical protein [Bhargavaea cecembensis]
MRKDGERITSIRYVKMHRRIHWLEQQTDRRVHELTLTDAAVCSHERDFVLGKVTDMSCRPIAGNSWFLYLHTDEGLFAFETEEHPEPFIRSYKNLKKW